MRYGCFLSSFILALTMGYDKLFDENTGIFIKFVIITVLFISAVGIGIIHYIDSRDV